MPQRNGRRRLATCPLPTAPEYEQQLPSSPAEGPPSRKVAMTSSSGNTTSVQVRVDGRCGTIVLKSPDRRNALDRDAWDQLQQALDDLHQQAGVRAIVLTGHGGCFSAGSDLHQIHRSMDDESPQPYWFADANQQRTVLTTMLQFPKPIIAAVNGPALGVGLGLVAACDLVLAAPRHSSVFRKHDLA